MSLHTRVYRTLTDPELRLAAALGLASVPVTVALSWGAVADERIVAGGTVSGAAFLVVGLLVGYLYHDRAVDSRRASLSASLAASVGFAVIALRNAVSTLGAPSTRATVFAVVATPIAILAGVVLTVLFVRVAAVVGDRFAAVRSWRAERGGEDERRRAAGDSKWWRYVAAYVVIAPVTAGYLFGTDFGSVGVLLGILLMFVTIIAAALALVSVYKDAERLYESGSPWIPNVAAYVGVPVAAFVVGHYLAAFNAWEAPVSMLGFLGACWFAAVVYLLDRRRAVASV